MIEPLIKQNHCAVCNNNIDHEKYYCFSVVPTVTKGNHITMGNARYGYLCTACGNKLKMENLFID